jgi:hypothetical protein
VVLNPVGTDCGPMSFVDHVKHFDSPGREAGDRSTQRAFRTSIPGLPARAVKGHANEDAQTVERSSK